MSRAIAILLVMLACAAACLEPRKIRIGAADLAQGKRKAPKSCGDNNDKHDCLKLGAEEGDCAWCKGRFMTGSCLSATTAKFIPEQVAHCKLAKKGDKVAGNGVELGEMTRSHGGYSPAGGGGDWPSGGGDWPSGGGDWPGGGGQGQGGCGKLKSKKKCLRGTHKEACAWCKNSFMGDSCVSESMAQYQKYFSTCKFGKKSRRGVAPS